MIPYSSGSIDPDVLEQIKESLEDLMMQLSASKKHTHSKNLKKVLIITGFSMQLQKFLKDLTQVLKLRF